MEKHISISMCTCNETSPRVTTKAFSLFCRQTYHQSFEPEIQQVQSNVYDDTLKRRQPTHDCLEWKKN